MRIVIVGYDRQGALERYCAAALREMGHEVCYHDLYRHITFRSRFLHRPLLSELERAALLPGFNRALVTLTRSWKPDLILVFKGLELFPATLNRLRRLPGRPLLVNWNPDNPFDRAPSNTSPRLIASISLYDVYFIWDRDLFTPLRQVGARRVEYLPFGYDPLTHRPIDLTQDERIKLRSQVCFVGNYTAERADLLSRLARTYQVGIWGENWRERLPANSPLRACLRGGWTYGEDMSRAFNAADIVMNFIRAQNGNAHNMRTFEVPAAQTFMLATRTRDQVNWLPEGIGAVYFGDPAEMEAKVAHYLPRPDERQRIALAGHRLITQGGHTYLDRMRHLLSVIEGL